eukprot:Em0004g116a
MPLHVLANFGGFLCECGLYISPINLLKASLVYGYHKRPILLSVSIRTAGRKLKHDGPNKTIIRGDRCLKDYGFWLSQAVDSAERFDSNWSKTKTTTAPTSPSLEVTLS